MPKKIIELIFISITCLVAQLHCGSAHKEIFKKQQRNYQVQPQQQIISSSNFWENWITCQAHRLILNGNNKAYQFHNYNWFEIIKILDHLIAYDVIQSKFYIYHALNTLSFLNLKDIVREFACIAANLLLQYPEKRDFFADDIDYLIRSHFIKSVIRDNQAKVIIDLKEVKSYFENQARHNTKISEFDDIMDKTYMTLVTDPRSFNWSGD